MTLADVLRNCVWIAPELILVATLCVILLMDVMQPIEKSPRTGWVMLAGLIVSLIAVLGGYGDRLVFTPLDPSVGDGPRLAFSNTIVRDQLGDFFKVVFLLGTIGCVLFSMRGEELKGYRHGEYYILMLGAVLGAMFLACSNNFLMLVLALETLSLSSYALAGYRKRDRLSAEASLKYVLYGSVASGVMLFGISYIYGMSGTLEIRSGLLRLAMGEDSGTAVLLAFVLVISGLGFKMAAVPFHFWAPDVYQGSPTAITAFLSTVSKAAGFAAAARVLLPLFGVSGAIVPDDVIAIRGPLLSLVQDGRLPLLFWILSVASMTLGNLVALRQSDIKRLMAYSSIAHAGYLLMPFTVYNQAALESVLFYLFIYLFMNLGAFLVIIIMIDRTGSSAIETYRGLGYRAPLLAVTLFVFLISLTGLPPTAGFLGKLNLFFAAWAESTWVGWGLASMLALNAAIAAWYYLRLVAAMYLESAESSDVRPVELGSWLGGLACAVATLVLFFTPQLLWDVVLRATN
jgi:NADH-quinone oxidoreductase subunit N